MSDFRPTQSVHGLPAAPTPKVDDDAYQFGSLPMVPLDTIESLLKLARSSSLISPDAEEELGPGDLQYLRGISKPSVPLPLPDWATSPGADRGTVIEPADRSGFGETPASAPIPITPAPVENSITANESASSKSPLTLDDLRNIELDIAIELGRTDLLIEDILNLKSGSVVSLDRLAGEPVDITANGKLIARGELLVINGKFGVRLRELV